MKKIMLLTILSIKLFDVKAIELIPYGHLAPIIEYNRKSIAHISDWLPSTYDNSLYLYGIKRSMLKHINKPLGNNPIIADIICFLSMKLEKPIKYLELGISVGKTFFQVSNYLYDATIDGIDLESINPDLESHFSKIATVSSWETFTSSLKNSPSSVVNYIFKKRNNSINYINADIYDENTWLHLMNKEYNIIFFDLGYSPEALLLHFQKAKKIHLIDKNEFILIWDDLETNEHKSAFEKIVHEVKQLYPFSNSSINELYSWFGDAENMKSVGIITNFIK